MMWKNVSGDCNNDVQVMIVPGGVTTPSQQYGCTGDILSAIGRKKVGTLGDGNCLFYAVVMQLLEGGDVKSMAQSLRNEVASASKKFMIPMRAFPGVWQRVCRKRKRERGGADSFPDSVEKYEKFIATKGTWANEFDLSLMAFVLHHNYGGKKLFVVDERFPYLMLKEVIDLSVQSKPYKREHLMKDRKVGPKAVTDSDVVVIFQVGHFSATAIIAEGKARKAGSSKSR